MSLVSVFWFRRDLRLDDNIALDKALLNAKSNIPVLCLFIFDSNILDSLPEDDARVSFIYRQLEAINRKLAAFNSSLLVMHGKPETVWNELLSRYDVASVFYNQDFESYGLVRDKKLKQLLGKHSIPVFEHTDHLIFEPTEILKNDNKPYTVFTPYKKKWLAEFTKTESRTAVPDFSFCFFQKTFLFPTLASLGFKESTIKVPAPNYAAIEDYENQRDFPALDATGRFGPHLRFGTLSIRELVNYASARNQTFLSELIWREFFIQVLHHFPHAENANFKPKYNFVAWRNDEQQYDKWRKGETGYPMVDAGMRQLNATGYMHNRLRMITAGFLCKHLLIDWTWGEAYFAEKLLDYELAVNNGNWQWAAGTGCDAAPYFRIFNPHTQFKKFDAHAEFVKQWVPEWGTPRYPTQMVEHRDARKAALSAFKLGIEEYSKMSGKSSL